MTAAQSTPLGEVDLYMPADWLDLLVHRGATGEIRELVARYQPEANGDAQDAMVKALLAWRAMLRGRGTLVHGIVAGPRLNDRVANWHVLVGVVDLPETRELDLARLLAHRIEVDLDDDASYVETFTTEMGRGLGMITQPYVEPPPALLSDLGVRPDTDRAVRIGLSAALTCPPAGGHGLLVVGVCVEPEHVAELAAVVAVIAGRSQIRPETRA